MIPSPIPFLNRPFTGRSFILAFLVLGIIAFWRLPGFSFLIGWDDQWFIINRYTENGFTWKNLSAIFTDFYYGQYAPINQLYYTCLYKLFGYSTKAFHLTSLLLHTVNTALVYIFIKRIGPVIIEESKLDIKYMASLTSMLFFVSPFNLEPIAWVAASKVLIYAMLYLLALITYLKYLEKGTPKYYYLVLVLYLISFGAKEQAVTLPLSLILIDIAKGRDLKKSIVWLEKLPIVVLTVFFGIITIQSQGVQIMEETHFYPIHHRILLSFYTSFEYLVKTAIPVNISYLYPFPFTVDSPAPYWLWIYPPAIIFIGYCFFGVLKKTWIWFGLGFFIIHVILVINLLSLARFSLVADRYAYVATIGIYFLISVVIFRLCKVPLGKTPIKIVSIAYLLYFTLYTRLHSPVWQDSITLKEQMREVIKKRTDYQKWNLELQKK